MVKYVEIHLMVEEQTLRDLKTMCNLRVFRGLGKSYPSNARSEKRR